MLINCSLPNTHTRIVTHSHTLFHTHSLIHSTLCCRYFCNICIIAFVAFILCRFSPRSMCQIFALPHFPFPYHPLPYTPLCPLHPLPMHTQPGNGIANSARRLRERLRLSAVAQFLPNFTQVAIVAANVCVAVDVITHTH